ncbi:hypothetical protein EV426DRAFT_601190 [Tirmania nivea]|nr:hypothetical protein EV426DRAFT_601190 [Tirmania nivea]
MDTFTRSLPSRPVFFFLLYFITPIHSGMAFFLFSLHFTISLTNLCCNSLIESSVMGCLMSPRSPCSTGSFGSSCCYQLYLLLAPFCIHIM